MINVKLLERLEQIEKVLEEDFKEVRKKVQAAVDASPKTVTYEEALKQVQNSLKNGSVV